MAATIAHELFLVPSFSGTGSNLKIGEAQNAQNAQNFDVPLHFYVVPLQVRGNYRETERREFTFMSDYETCNITVLVIYLTTQTGNSIRPRLHIIKLGRKLGGVTAAPLVLPVTDAKEDGFKW